MIIENLESQELRKDFSKIPEVLEIPHLLDVQIKSYKNFLQADIAPDQRLDIGLHGAFKAVFPLEEQKGKASLEYLSYRLDKPKYDFTECRLKGYTYTVPLYVTFRLIIWDSPEEGEPQSAEAERQIRDIKEQEIYFGEIQLMTESGSFIVNGTERVIVSQLHRSPGVFFDQDKSKDQSSGKGSFVARIVPQNGHWLDFEYDLKDILHVRIDRKKKFHVTVLLRAMGYDEVQIMDFFYPVETFRIEQGPYDISSKEEEAEDGEDELENSEDTVKELDVPYYFNKKVFKDITAEVTYLEAEGFAKRRTTEIIASQKAAEDIKHPETGEILVRKDRKFKNFLGRLENSDITSIHVPVEDLLGKCSAQVVENSETGEIILDFNEEITEEKLEELMRVHTGTLRVYYIDNTTFVSSLRTTLLSDKMGSCEDAVTEIYRKFRPTEPPSQKVARDFFKNMFFTSDNYRLSKVGRIKINYKLGREHVPEDHLVLDHGDILLAVKYLHDLKGGKGSTDDIDHLGNRRVRTVGELIEDRFYHGLGRLAKSVKERMGYQNIENFMPNEVLVPKTVTSVLKEFFTTGQLSQFMDQTNPLSEITHKRRLSALGPGGLTRERAGFEVRDVHSSHYGRICPIETPEGPNIGLISSLSTYGRVDESGFIQTPYRKVYEKPVGNYSAQDIHDPGTGEKTLGFGEEITEEKLKNVRDIAGEAGSILYLDKKEVEKLRGVFEIRRSETEHTEGSPLSRFLLDVQDPDTGEKILDVEKLRGVAEKSGAQDLLDDCIKEYDLEKKDVRVTDEIDYMNALKEESYKVAQANAPLAPDGSFHRPTVSARVRGEFKVVSREEVELMDVSPSQLVSVSASLIPFLEHDDANRALMGSNMQRQAVPLVRSCSPIVGTGFESNVAKDSGVTVVAKRDGVVEYVDAVRIVVKSTDETLEDGGVDIYNLIKFHRSNQNSCWNQTPIVSCGQHVRKGQVIADGCSTDRGELALGQNMVVAFMPWGGYNFEDAILISERVVKDDAFTSIHIEEFECTARDTKLGKEEITRDIPNVSEEALRYLDDSGIIMIGAEVEPGDILVGKVSPKAETQLSPEERLLRAIFGDKAGDVKDSSLKVSSGVQGTVIDVETLIARSVEKDERSVYIEKIEIEKLNEDRDNEIAILKKDAVERIKEIVVGRTSLSKITVNRKKVLESGQEITEDILDGLPIEKIAEIRLKGETDPNERRSEEQRAERNRSSRKKGTTDAGEKVSEIVQRVLSRVEECRKIYKQREEKFRKPDELPPGVLRVVKVRIAVKRKLQVGDKMAGRHGNKGVVSKILPQEDMPYLADGRPVDMVLNPLGVPSRMNVGQILETHLGWAGRELGRQLDEYLETEFGEKALRTKLLEIYGDSSKQGEFVKTLDRGSLVELAKKLKNGVPVKSPVFDGAKESEIAEMQKLAGINRDGKTVLFDGRTGEPFDQKVCVGVMYMLKLHHLVEEKIHARAIGPYSLVTQQPLGGKAHFGGQRLGEMEVWALEAYGAAYTLQEFVTIKSDDVAGRTRIFDSIVRGDMNFEPGLPESFKVLRRELQALGLDVDLMEEEAEEVEPIHNQ